MHLDVPRNHGQFEYLGWIGCLGGNGVWKLRFFYSLALPILSWILLFCSDAAIGGVVFFFSPVRLLGIFFSTLECAFRCTTIYGQFQHIGWIECLGAMVWKLRFWGQSIYCECWSRHILLHGGRSLDQNKILSTHNIFLNFWAGRWWHVSVVGAVVVPTLRNHMDFSCRSNLQIMIRLVKIKDVYIPSWGSSVDVSAYGWVMLSQSAPWNLEGSQFIDGALASLLSS